MVTKNKTNSSWPKKKNQNFKTVGSFHSSIHELANYCSVQQFWFALHLPSLELMIRFDFRIL